jgi:tetratricopeptide (TPR) repeat protein
MKTYRNEKHGFEIDLPENWQPAPIPPARGKDLFQYGCFNEAINFEIGSLFPEPLLDDTETEFRLYARDRGFSELRFGRIVVAGKEHVCARYLINDNMGRRWNKKYMIVFGGTEYTITGTCNDPQWFAKREKDWDAIIQSFRLLSPVVYSANAPAEAAQYRNQRRDIIEQRTEMREIAGTLYAQAYEAVALGRYSEARTLLEKCLNANPDHALARKELAVVLQKLGNMRGAVRQRKEVKRLAPSDWVNRLKLAELLAECGARGEALRETRELLVARSVSFLT